jgi:aquaporin Z
MTLARGHWPEYLIEGALLGAFMVSAVGFGTLLEHPASPVRGALADSLLRRVLMGLAMGATAIALIHSRWGKRSGAHFNPAVTLTFLRLGKIEPGDALFYVSAQFVGGAVGLFAAGLALGMLPADPHIGWVATVPGSAGVAAAFAAEVAISFVLMLTVLAVSNTARLSRFTGFFAGGLVALWITIEAPISGMSMNPARTFASAVVAGNWTSIWIYFAAPLTGMLLASEAFVRMRSLRAVHCAKLHHDNDERCIFRCSYHLMEKTS